ncbi:MAG: Rifampicin monooxygenase [Chlamydiia bacterium]|nr:Rifampicin monooxygenase [Chlamydiia bacterium]
MESVDVLVVGAGPTGLTFAIECMRYGLSCKIIDQAPEPTTYSKAAAVQSRTLEILQRMGIADKFLSVGTKIKAANLHSKHKTLGRIEFNDIDSPYSFVLGIEQNKTEKILTDHLRELGCEVDRPNTLTSYEEGDMILATTDKGIIQAKYLIGCDGAHSVVRKQLGCTFKGKSFPDVFSLADVHIDWEYPSDELQVFLENKYIMAFFPLSEKDRYRIVFQLERLRNMYHGKDKVEHGIIQSDESQLPKLDEIQGLLSASTDKKAILSDPRWIANFHINSRLSNFYRRNNIFLVGDAAHIHSPVGGQGMNTGMQDAFNLAWKTAYTHKNLTQNSNLLDSFEKERHALGKVLLSGTERTSNMITIHSPFLLFIRRHLIKFFLSFKSIRKKITTAISETNIGYPQKRMPNIKLINGEYFKVTEKSTNFHLILFNQKESPIDNPQLEVYYANESTSAKAVLIRPDGYIELEDYPPFKKLKQYRI